MSAMPSKKSPLIVGKLLCLVIVVSSVLLFRLAIGWSTGEKAGLVGLLGVLCLLPLAATSRNGVLEASVGATIAAFCYLLLSLGPGNETPDLPYLPTTRLLDFFYKQAYTRGRLADLARQTHMCTCSECIAEVSQACRTSYFRIGHVFFGFVAAMTVGAVAWAWRHFSIKCLGVYLARKREGGV